MGWKKTLGTFGIVVYLLHEAFFVGILGSLLEFYNTSYYFQTRKSTLD
jgi:hypothetical protein